jgi:urease accessory protein
MVMTMRTALRAGLVLAALAAASVAQAHPFHAGDGWSAGLAHPFLGADHALAMIAVGIWAAQLGRRATFGVPLAFVAVVALGAALALAGVALPLVEPGIAASVLALGLLVAFAVRLPFAAAAGLVAGFALLHGHAHGLELPAMASAVTYVAGFAAATALLHVLGILVGRTLHGRAVQLAGVCVALSGVALIAGM